MMLTFKGDPGNERVFAQVTLLQSLTRTSIRQAFYAIGKDLKDTSQELILSGPKTGRIYKKSAKIFTIKNAQGGSYRYSTGVRNNHQASAPGQAPANLSGNLRKSIGYDIRGGEQLEFGSRNMVPMGGKADQNVAAYARRLELGDSKMGARPYLRPAFAANQANITEHFIDAFVYMVGE